VPSAGDAPRGRRRWGLAAAAALGVALFAVPFLRTSPSSSTAADSGPSPAAVAGAGTCAVSQGSARFDFTLKDMNGASVRLADYKGKVVLLNFWATWCGPCRTEIPELVRLVDDHKDEGFEVLGVSIDDTPEQLQAFARDMKINYPSLLMLEELDNAFGPMWALPTTFIIDRHGSICLKHMGPVTREMVEREIKGLL
jgi:peroxiredoxin